VRILNIGIGNHPIGAFAIKQASIDADSAILDRRPPEQSLAFRCPASQLSFLAPLHEEPKEEEQNNQSVGRSERHASNEAAIGLDMRLEVGAPRSCF
jgi:hypothetical protein